MFRPRNHILLLLLAIGALLLPPNALAQTPDDVTVRLSSFDPWAAPDRPLRVALEVTNGGATALEDVAVRLTIRQRVRSRSALRVALDREPSGESLAVTTEELTEPLAPGQTAAVTVQRDLGSLANAFLADRGGSGVYPLTIEVRARERTVEERSSAFVFLATPPETQLNVVWVVPLHRAAAIDAGGAYNVATLSKELLENGTLRRTIEILERHSTMALTLAPTGLLADQLLDVSNGFDAREEGGGRTPVAATDAIPVAAQQLLGRLRAALASPVFEIATMPYARADLSALTGAGMSIDAAEQIAVGRETVQRLLLREPNAAVLANGNYWADAGSARTIAAQGTKTLLLDPDALRDRPEGRFGNPDRPEEVRASGESFDALLVDVPIRDRLQPPPDADPVLQAMGVLAEAAVSYFEVPGLAPARSLVLATDSMPSPAIAGPLMDALAQTPWARVRTASDVMADPELGTTGEPLRFAPPTETTPSRLITAKAARRTLDVFGRVVQAPDLLADLHKRILIAESADYSGGEKAEGRGAAYARSARDRADGTLAAITVPSRRVTLTSRGGRVPVTVVNQTGYEIRVRVSLDSAKVAFPDGEARRVTVESKPGRRTLTFELEARTAGSFPIDVVIETPDGEHKIGSGQLLIRSTAVSTVAFAATAGGALFLLGAWARRAFVRRPKGKATG